MTYRLDARLDRLEKRAPRVSEAEREKTIKMLIEKIGGGKPPRPIDERHIERKRPLMGQKIFDISWYRAKLA
jgi:hypothetical protein